MTNDCKKVQQPPEMASPSLLCVAVPLALPDLQYLPPPGDDPLRPLGSRVRVPVGSRQYVGVLVAITPTAAIDPQRLRPATAWLGDEPLLSGQDLDLLRWCAGYYRYPLGLVWETAVPAVVREKGLLPPPENRGWRLTEAAPLADAPALARAPRQQALLETLRAGPQSEVMLRQSPAWDRAMVRRCQEKGWITSWTPPTDPCEPAPLAALERILNAEQSVAVAAVGEQLGRFGCFVLEGVTGSGKTEVYLALAHRVVSERREQVLLLVPEIALTPQLLSRFQAVFGDTVAVLHSGLSDGDRARHWSQAARGALAVVIGTRSALFVPLPRLGLILVDEEHEPSFKQVEGLRYQARDVAVWRAHHWGCPVLLGSATPALETLHNLAAGRYRHLTLTERANGAVAPHLALVDLAAGNAGAGLTAIGLAAVRTVLERGEQVLLFLNRRGFAPVLACVGCGWIAPCPHCDAKLVVHRREARVCCHHCGWSTPEYHKCSRCGAAPLIRIGQGTERVENEVADLFPGQTLLRIDRDTVRRRDALQTALAAAQSGQAGLLIGTQMLAKGHHFPHLTLAVVMDADQGLFSTDFRAAERLAQQIVQVAGRAGRADRPGRVLIQTRFPHHPLLIGLLTGGYRAFAETALDERRQAALPPYSYQALLRAEAKTPEPPQAFLVAARDRCLAQAMATIRCYGPAPAPMQRRAGFHRFHLLVEAPERRALHQLLDLWLPGLKDEVTTRSVRWALDVDPQEG
ncbi:MAG: primosomal protein N' [Pseudomonadota bacterium]